MTSQILIPDSLLMPIADATEPEGYASDLKPFSQSNCFGNCQAELRHLQAETEALLQQLQTLKQQRLAAIEPPDQTLGG